MTAGRKGANALDSRKQTGIVVMLKAVIAAGRARKVLIISAIAERRLPLNCRCWL
jgi:hypothetical protein